MKLKFATDLHLFGPHQIGTVDDLTKGKVDYLLGDIVDMHCVSSSKVEKAHRTLIRLMKKFKGRYTVGNHELSGFFGDKIITCVVSEKSRYLFTHGHHVLWDASKVEKWIRKPYGMGFLTRYGVWIANKFREIFSDGELKKEEIEALGEFALTYKCNGIVIGHLHSKTARYYTYFNGSDVVDIYVLPRGITTLDLH